MVQEPCAIVGMAFRFPNRIESPQALLQALSERRDCVSQISESRKHLLGDLPEDYPLAVAGLDEIDRFEARLFGINGLEASYMDPQQRLLLELAWAALEDAALPWDRLANARTGVFVGAHSHDYLERAIAAGTESAAYWNPGLNGAALSNRISHFFDFHGPSMTLNTACASSLEALVQACAALQTGQCDHALVGGVNLILSPHVTMGALRAGMLSPQGRCKAFDASANGFVRGEGAVMLVLKGLQQARADGDRILGKILGSCSGHGGRARSFTAPNLKQQRDLIARTIQAAGLVAEDIGCIEAHGTGTSLGDSVEVAALKEAFAATARGSLSAGRVGLSSLKTNLGHLEAAAGLAAVVKMIVTMRAGKLAPLVHLEVPNPHLELDDSPFYLIDRWQEWPNAARRIAGISSFGFGGSGAHVILEADANETQACSPGLRLFPLSAHNSERLLVMAARLADHLEREAIGLDIVAHSLQRGRRHLQARALFQAESLSELITELRNFAKGDGCEQVPQALLKRVGLPGKRPAKAGLVAYLKAGDLASITNAWLKGEDIPWEVVWPAGSPRVALPHYPFAGNCYWLPARS